MFVDFVAGELLGPVDLRMLVGCESEMHSAHHAGYSLDDPKNDYAKDFRKVFRFPAPVLLFAARKTPAQMAQLEDSLARLARDFNGDWSAKRLYIVLLPSAKTRRRLTRLGIGEPDGSLRFEPLDESAGAPAAGGHEYATLLR
jgi:hypothetical protein